MKPQTRLIEAVALPRGSNPNLSSTTWEQRQGYRDRSGARIPDGYGVGMTAEELTEAMGVSHVNHPGFKRREYPLNPEPNLARRLPTISCTEYGIFAQWRNLFRWLFN